MKCAHCKVDFEQEGIVECSNCNRPLCDKCLKVLSGGCPKNRDKSPERPKKKNDACSVCSTKRRDHAICRNMKEEYENILLIHNRLNNALQACQKIIDAIDSPGTVKQSELYYQVSVLDDELDVARKLSDHICE